MANEQLKLERELRRAQRELEDLQLVLRARNGDHLALDALIRRYTGFVRLKASSYFLAGGEADDLVQEGLIGLYKAVRDFRPDKETSFRSFAELCVTRQVVTAVKTATRYKHFPLNTYVSFEHVPAGSDLGDDSTLGDSTLGDALPAASSFDPPSLVISSEELQSLVFTLSSGLSRLETDALRLYLEGSSYEEIADALGCDTKTIDNALQRVKRKVLNHQRSREILDGRAPELKEPLRLHQDAEPSGPQHIEQSVSVADKCEEKTRSSFVEIEVWTSSPVDELELRNAIDAYIRFEGFELVGAE